MFVDFLELLDSRCLCQKLDVVFQKKVAEVLRQCKNISSRNSPADSPAYPDSVDPAEKAQGQAGKDLVHPAPGGRIT